MILDVVIYFPNRKRHHTVGEDDVVEIQWGHPEEEAGSEIIVTYKLGSDGKRRYSFYRNWLEVHTTGDEV